HACGLFVKVESKKRSTQAGSDALGIHSQVLACKNSRTPQERYAMAQQVSGQPRYKRILLKLSGEALMGSEEFGIDPKVLDRMALEVGQLVGIGVQVGLVIGGGNLFRGAALS